MEKNSRTFEKEHVKTKERSIGTCKIVLENIGVSMEELLVMVDFLIEIFAMQVIDWGFCLSFLGDLQQMRVINKRGFEVAHQKKQLDGWIVYLYNHHPSWEEVQLCVAHIQLGGIACVRCYI